MADPRADDPTTQRMLRYVELFPANQREGARVTVNTLKRLGKDLSVPRRLSVEELELIIDEDFD